MGKFQDLVKERGYDLTTKKSVYIPTPEEKAQWTKQSMGLGGVGNALSGGLLGADALTRLPISRGVGIGTASRALSGGLQGADLNLQELYRAHDDLYVLEGPYGYLANDTLSPEKRAEYQARYDEILGQYGSDVTSESLWEQINDLESGLSAAKDQVTTMKNMADYSAMSAEEQLAFRRYAEAMSAGAVSFGSDGKIHSPIVEIQAKPEIQAIIAKYGKERVEEIAETLKWDLNRELAEEASALGQEIGETLGFGAIPLGVAGGIFGTPANLMGLVNEAITGTGQYSTTDPYHSGSMMSTLTQGIGAGGAKKAPEQIVNFLEMAGRANPYSNEMGGVPSNYSPQLYEATRGTKVREVIDTIGSGAYQVVNTTAESLARAYLGAGIFGAGTTGAKAASLGLAGLRSFGDTYNDVSAKGGTPAQAAILGAFNAGTEIATEYLPLEEWWKVAENGSDSVHAMLKEAARQGAIEMSQEELGFLATTMMEYAVLREKSEFQVLKRDLIASGKTPEEAEMLMWKEFGAQLLETGITSFFSGGLSEAGAEVYNTFATKMQYNALPNQIRSSTERLEGLDREAALDTSGRLYEMEQKIISRQNVNEISAALQEAGVSRSKANKIAGAYALDFSGIALTEEQRQLLDSTMENEKLAAAISGAVGWEAFAKRNLALDDFRFSRTSRNASRTNPDGAGAEIGKAEDNLTGETNRAYTVSEDGRDHLFSSPERSVTVTGIVSTDGGKVTVRLDDGSQAELSDVIFGDDGKAVVFSYFADMGNRSTAALSQMSVDTMNELIGLYDPKVNADAFDYVAAAADAYFYGYYGIPQKSTPDGITENQQKIARNRGAMDGMMAVNKAQNEVKRKAGENKGDRKGKLHFERNGRTFSKQQEASLGALEALSKALGVDIYVYESYEEGGKRVYQSRSGEVKSAPNGFYDEQGIHIDLNAGNFGQGTMMFTAAHELTHFIKEWSPVKFRKLAQLLVDRYGEQGVSVRDLIDNQIVKAEKNGRTIDRDTAFEEVAADSMEVMLTQGDAAKFMASLKQQDKTLWEKVKQWFQDLADKLRSVVDAYKGVTPDSPEGRLVAQMEDFIGVLQEAYSEALVDASENYRASEGNKKTTWEGGVKYSLPDIASIMRTDDEVENNIRYVASMDSVYHVSANNLEFGNQRVQDIYKHYFDMWGNNIHSDIFGDIAAVNSSVRSEKRHGTTPPKIASIEAIPAVIQNGKIIGYINKHNGKLLRIVVAAPINIGDTQYYMGVMLQRDTQNQRLYIHDVVINKEASELSQEHLDSTGPYEENEDLFLTSIIKKVLAVKSESKEKLSDRDPTAAATAQELEKQNEKLKQDVKDLRELLRMQGKLTRGTEFRKSSIDAEVKSLAQTAGATLDAEGKAQLHDMLKDFYKYIASDGNLAWEGVQEEAGKIADFLQSNVKFKPERSEYARDVLGYLRGQRVSLSDSQRSEVEKLYGYENYRKQLFGAGVYLSKDGIALDSLWHEAAGSDMFPGTFDIDILEGNQPAELLRIIVGMREDDGSGALEYAYNREFIRADLVQAVYDSYWLVDNMHTVADRKQREINEIRRQHNQRMETMKADRRETVQRLRADFRRALKAVKEDMRQTEREHIQKAVDRQREIAKNAADRRKETMAKRDARAKLDELVLDTVGWITAPKKGTVKCPDFLKKPYMDFLDGIDMSSKQMEKGGDPTKADLKLTNAMNTLANTIEKITIGQDPSKESADVLDSGYLDLPADFVQKLRDMTEEIREMMESGGYVINSMTAKEVRKLSSMIRTLNRAVRAMNTLYANGRYVNVQELGVESIRFLDALGNIESTSGVTDFVQWDNALPYYAFKRFGAGGESVFEGLMDAQDKLAFLAKQIFEFQEKTWTGEEADAWSKDVHTIELEDDITETGEVIKRRLTLTTADAMCIYCLYQREQGRKHLLGGGVRVIGIQKGSKKAPDSKVNLVVEDIDKIISSLSDRQIEVAKSIQQFMSTVCADWGNEISMKRFLTREFSESSYFPIESDDENMTQKDSAAKQSDLFRLLNISATKGINPNANNRAIVRNIFDVFTGHASDMARLNAYALPLLDYMKWYNYREKEVTENGQVINRGVRQSMRTAYGDAAKGYVMNLIKDVNGRPSDGGLPSFYTRMLKNAKTAMVGSSLRVATLQVTSYPRAALVLSPKSLAMGLTKIPSIEKAKKYCGIALWKSFGFYDTNISRSIEDQMKGVKDVRQKIIELSLKGAEIGDAITWGALWNACEYEVASTEKYKVGSEEFYQAVGRKLREVVYATQVVDSTLTRSEAMRSKNAKMQELSSFMSEPTLSANILMDAGFRFYLEKRRAGNAKAAWKNTGKYVGKALAVYSIGQLAAALLEGFWDAWRDDEDEEFWRKWVEAFAENLALDIIPFNKIPIISDIAEAALSLIGLGYFSSESLSSTALSQTVAAFKAWSDVISGKSSSTVYNALYKSMRAVSSFLGVSVSGVMREGVALWNNTAGAYDSTLKIRTYESAETRSEKLYKALVTGDTVYLDRQRRRRYKDEDAYASAVRNALRENDPRIKEAATARFDGDFSRYRDLFYEIRDEGVFDFDTIMAAINAEVNALEKLAKGEVAEEKKDDPYDALFNAENYYTAVLNGDEESANAIYEELIADKKAEGYLRSEAMDSIASSFTSQVKKEYMDRNITRDKAIELLAENTDHDESKVKEWDFEQEHEYSWSARARGYRLGNISGEDLIEAVMDIEGADRETAEQYIRFLDLEMAHEDVEATAADAESYFKWAEPVGVGFDIWIDYKERTSGIENDKDPATGKSIKYTAVKKIMAIIDSLPISDEQKTAIAKSNGWADSTICEYKLW